MERNIQILSTDSWPDYELLDSGDNEKLERFGTYVFIRPEPKSLWHKSNPSLWSKADAIYHRDTTGGGKWQYHRPIRHTWTIKWNKLTFSLKPTGFKHLGIFPEQTAIWEFIHKKITSNSTPTRVLNLFSYTGGSTLASAEAGATVTHVDSAKDILTWANDNAKLSDLDSKPIRWIPEDAITFVKREIKRGSKYEAIIMDPPKFGRGSKNEVWKIEEDLPKLVDLCSQLLTEKPLFFIINTYAVSFSAVTLSNMLSQTMKKYGGKITCGELAIKHSTNNLLLSQSIYGMWESI